ncbi:MAG: helix-turn-helix domain-containing protein [Anaeroplasma bactoclasticum]|nr:helix-turn-helix domain-containing protein [Anaeroplasma bactoclasticum]
MIKTISKCLSLRIREILASKNLSIYKLELLTGISHSTMSCLLNNRYNSANIKTVLIIIQALDMSVVDFFDCELFADLNLIDID